MLLQVTIVAFLQLWGAAIALPADQKPLTPAVADGVLKVRAEYVINLQCPILWLMCEQAEESGNHSYRHVLRIDTYDQN